MIALRGALKQAEEDDFLNGCDPSTRMLFDTGHIDVELNNVESAIDYLRSEFGVAEDCIVLDACEENGRIDVHRMENAQGDEALPEQIKKWMDGEERLWYVVYTVYASRIVRTEINLIEELKRERSA